MLTVTTVVNLVALSACLWLGFYIVTRSPRSRVSWLASFTLWFGATHFLYNAVIVNMPERALFARIRPLVVLALPPWFHLTLLLTPKAARWWWTRTLTPRTRRIALLAVYGIAITIVLAGVVPTRLPQQAAIGAQAYLSGRPTSALYPSVAVFLALMCTLSLPNLWLSQRHTHDRNLARSFTLLSAATILATLGGLYIALGVALRLKIPTFPGDTLIAAGVVLLGYTVARHNALIEVRAIQRDFLYALLAAGLLTGIYYLLTLVLYLYREVSFLTLLLAIAIAISSHALYDGIRFALDRVFYRKQFRELRSNLRTLASDAGIGQPLAVQLQAVLRSLCRTLGIGKGFIALHHESGFVVEATQRIRLEKREFPLSALCASEIVHLPLRDRPLPEDMALLVPLRTSTDQLGALVLSTKESHQPYSEEEFDLIEGLADQMANVIHTSQLQGENAQAINELVADLRKRERMLQMQVQQMLAEREAAVWAVLEGISQKQFNDLVEDGLRRLHDYPYLGSHTLAQMQVVSWQLEERDGAFVTHIDRGKALNEVLLQALGKLRPEGTEPPSHQVPSREWYQFIVLHDAYALGRANRDIMSRLYISEGTFNRTRRRAIGGVARALQEMEREARRRET